MICGVQADPDSCLSYQLQIWWECLLCIYVLYNMTYFQGRLVNRPQMAYILPVYDIKRRLLIELPLLLEMAH